MIKRTLFIVMVASLLGNQQAEQKTKTRTLMTNMLYSLQTLLPLSLKEEEFSDKKNQELISKELNNLASNSKGLSEHFSQHKTSDYSFIARSIARDASELEGFYNNQSFEQARFIIHNISGNCVTCHLKAPSKKDFAGPGQLFAKINTELLTDREHAKFKVMSRQFSEALSLYEKALLTTKPFDSDLIVDFLKVSLIVKRDAKKAKEVLQKLAAQPDLKKSWKQRLSRWVVQVENVQAMGALEKPTLEKARKLATMSGDPKLRPVHDQENVVLHIAASAILHQMLNENEPNNLRDSEIYFMLGKAEESLADSIWVSEIENYLEQSIRLAPRSKWSKLSYELLEDQYVLGYSGSSGTHIPDDVKKLLDELKVLAGLNNSTSTKPTN